MSTRPNASVKATPGLGWARRVVCQQLDALRRLGEVARRLIDPAAVGESSPARSFSAAARGLEKAVRLQARVLWALRLIEGLRARLLADLQAVESGPAAAPAGEARSFAAEPELAMAKAAPSLADTAERLAMWARPERPERPERLVERERFGFEGRGSEDRLAQILRRPPAEIIALICRELGLPDDWPQRAEQAWARAQADEVGGEPRPPPPGGAASPSWIDPAPS